MSAQAATMLNSLNMADATDLFSRNSRAFWRRSKALCVAPARLQGHVELRVRVDACHGYRQNCTRFAVLLSEEAVERFQQNRFQSSAGSLRKGGLHRNLSLYFNAFRNKAVI